MDEDKKISEKVLDGVQKGLKITFDSAKTFYKKTLTNMYYVSSSSLFCVSNNENEEKLIHGIFDENNLILYIKQQNFKKYQNFLKEDNILRQEQKPNNQYKIIQVDNQEPFEYLLKVNHSYKTIKCYQIYLEKLEN